METSVDVSIILANNNNNYQSERDLFWVCFVEAVSEKY